MKEPKYVKDLFPIAQELSERYNINLEVNQGWSVEDPTWRVGEKTYFTLNEMFKDLDIKEIN